MLGELLTPQYVFQDSNCGFESSLMGMYECDDVVRSGAKANTFSSGKKVKMLFDFETLKTLSAHREDFVKMTPLKQAKLIQGAGSRVVPKGTGLVRYDF